MLRTSLLSYLALKQGDQTTSHRRPSHVVCIWVCAYHAHVPCVGRETFLSQAFHTLHILSLQPSLTSLTRGVEVWLALPHCAVINWQCKPITSTHFTSSSCWHPVFCYHCLFSTHSNYFLTRHSLHIIHRHTPFILCVAFPHILRVSPAINRTWKFTRNFEIFGDYRHQKTRKNYRNKWH